MTATIEEQRLSAKKRAFPSFLESGMHLSQPEFHRYYELEPKHVRGELVKGVVFMASPQSKWHGDSCLAVGGCLTNYVAGMRGVHAGSCSSIILNFSNEYQPDLHVRLDENLGGQCRADGEFLQNAPELIVEVALSSFAYDLHEKLEVYQNHKVREYLVWRGDRNQFTCFRLEGGSFVPVPFLENGVFKSSFFGGLWIDTSALAGGDWKKALETVQQGLQSPEAKEFQSELERRKAKS